jgi:hypothetical protein
MYSFCIPKKVQNELSSFMSIVATCKGWESVGEWINFYFLLELYGVAHHQEHHAFREPLGVDNRIPQDKTLHQYCLAGVVGSEFVV